MTAPSHELNPLLDRIRECTLCESHLEHGARPVVQARESARVLIAGQAPGRRVHETGIPFNDPSGDRLRRWMGVDREAFYDPARFAIVPMGFCYPGKGKSGDLPPRPECADAWRIPLLAQLPNIQLTLVIGSYALDWHLPKRERTVTETVKRWKQHAPSVIPLPHPSPRNTLWLRKNPWFEAEVVPFIHERIQACLGR